MTLEELTRAVEKAHGQIGRASYYELLGVEVGATEDAIRIAFRTRARDFHSDSHANLNISPQLQTRMERVMGELSAAYAVLSDKAKREEYDALLSLTAAGVPTDIRLIFKADDSFKDGKKLVERAQFDAALAKFNEAIECNPTEPDFWAYLRWTEFCLLETDKAGKPLSPGSVERIRRALTELAEKHEHCDVAYVFLGHIARAVGDTDGAVGHYRRALARNPKNSVAQTNMRVIKMRKAKESEGFFAKLFRKR